jgi:hypothetical protein
MSEATSRSSAFGSMLRAFLAVFAFVFAPSIAVEALVRAFGDEAMRTSMPAKMGGVAFAARWHSGPIQCVDESLRCRV